jgi:hypothetical protein
MGDAVGIAAEVGEHVLRAGEGRLAVDDPGLLAQLAGLLAQLAEPRGKGRGVGEGREAAGHVEVAPVEGPLQTSEIPAAEDLGQRAHGKEEAGPRGNPAPPIGRERATGHDAVHVHMRRERLAPGMEHGGHAELPAEVARIAAEPRERGGGGVKEQPIE